MKVVVIGATGGSGQRAVAELLARGHQVTAFARRPERLGPEARGARVVRGDATDADAVASAVAGQDAVVVTLGISESPLRVRVRGPRETSLAIRSDGTLTIIGAMQDLGVRRLVVQSSFGVGVSRDRLRLADRAVFQLLLRPQIEDTERQEAAVRASGLDWVLVQPVHLRDGDASGSTLVSSASGSTLVSSASEVHGMRVTRQQVAAVLADAVEPDAVVRRTLAVSTGPPVVDEG